MKTIVGLYDNMEDAEKAITDLVQAGFDRSDISLMAADQWTDESGATVHGGTTNGDGDSATIGAMAATDVAATNGEQMASDVTTGAVTGGVVGGLTGVLLGWACWPFLALGRCWPLGRWWPGWPARASARPSAAWSARWLVGVCRRMRLSCTLRACAAAASWSV